MRPPVHGYLTLFSLSGGNAPSAGQQGQQGGNHGNQPLLPPPLINTQQAQQPAQNYLPFNQMGSGNEQIAGDGLNSSPVPNPSTPAPAPFPLYASKFHT